MKKHRCLTCNTVFEPDSSKDLFCKTSCAKKITLKKMIEIGIGR